jgi:hypothetical protein
MPNGHDPPSSPRRLSNTDYQTIKSGTLITSGTYAGCIKVGVTHYWIAPNGSDWDLNDGTPDETQTEITTVVWDKCKDGGSLSWDARDEHWEGGGNTYRWAGDSGEDVQLVEL